MLVLINILEVKISKIDAYYVNMQKGYLNVHRYKAFLKVVEVGSFTKAAELLGYTQPALSQMMTSLERELSMKLLYRSRYGIRLTPEGERLYPFVQNAEQQYDAMRRSADEISGLETGVVRTGAVDFGFVNPQAVKGLETMVVKSGQFRAVVPIGHPLAERECATLEELAVEPFLMVESGAYGEAEEAFAAAGIVRAAKQV